MKTKLMVLAALRHALLQESPKDIDWDRLESAVIALEADIAKGVEPVGEWRRGDDGEIKFTVIGDPYVVNGAKLYTTPQEPAAIPAGWQLAPIEPTDAIRRAWFAHRHDSFDAGVYRAMLAEAPGGAA
jgi:hypothetical protein